MRVSQTGLEFIKHFEGCKLDAYSDVAGIWTIGYGHTGEDVKPGLQISEIEAEDILRQDLARFEQDVSRLVKAKIDQNQFDALTSLTFNIGSNAFKRSTVLRELNKGNYLSAANAITWWNKATIDGEKQEVAGLTRRRAAEKALFLQDVGAGEAGDNKKDSTRIVPEESSPRRGNIARSRTVEGSAVAGAGGAVGAAATMMNGEEETETAESPVVADETTAAPPETVLVSETGPGDIEAGIAADVDKTEESPDPVTETTSPDSQAQAESVSADPEPQTDIVGEPLPLPAPAEVAMTEVGTAAADQPPTSSGELKDAIQIAAGIVVILAVIYIMWARVDDWLNYRR